MKKTTRIKILWVFFLVLTLSIGSQQLRSFAAETTNSNSTVIQNKDNTSKQSASETSPLKNANNEFLASFDDFIKQLQTKSNNNPEKGNSVSSEDVVLKLEKLEISIKTLKFHSPLSKDIKDKIKNIESGIIDTKNVLALFQVNNQSVLETQKEPRARKNSQLLDNQDKFNKETSENFDNLSRQKQKIFDEINTLETLVYPKKQKLTVPINVNNNNQGNNTIHFLWFFTCLLLFLIGVIVGILTILLWEKNQKSKKKCTPKPSQHPSTVQHHQTNTNIGVQTTAYQQNISNQTAINPQTTSPPIIHHRIQPPDVPTPPADPFINNLDTTQSFVSSEQIITREYNQNRKQVCKNASEVSETVDSINQRRLGVNHSVILEKVSKNKGNYCIIPEQGFSYLLPKDNLRINEYNYETVTILFDCYNYQPGRSSDFRLKTPAVVVTENHDTWRLQQKGELQFL
ncbi:hypothetical protein H6G36_03660 [Anabaena minutissima FACHB-250]|nr:hypothetical protein [Anabaena minutissima FACHB-250]